ncbi:MAG: hypothetical protein ACI8RD_008930 [Bacillariaceae sp.]|jgi:hypothetical protein
MLDERLKQAEMDCENAFRKEEHVAISSESDADATPSLDDNIIIKEPKEQQDDGSSNDSNNNNNFTPIAPKPHITNNNDGPQALRSGRWTPDEKCLFLYGLRMFGKGRWKKMSCFLPHRSLVQIKSHAQKVLKRQQTGENIFRRLEDNYHEIDNLVVQAARQRDALRLAGIDVNNNNNNNTTTPTISSKTTKKITTTKSSSAAAAVSASTGKLTNKQQNELKSTSAASAKKKQHRQRETIQAQVQAQIQEVVQENNISEPINNNNAVDPEYQTPDGSVLAAAALCQLSSIGGAWMGPKR